MWELDHKESWVLNNWCFWIVVLEKTLNSPLDSKEIKPVNRKGNQCWIFIGRTDAEAEAPFGHLMWRVDILEKTLKLGKIEVRRRRERQRMRLLYGITDSIDMNLSKLRDSGKQRSLTWCNPWSSRVRHNLATEQQHLSYIHVNTLECMIFAWKKS